MRSLFTTVVLAACLAAPASKASAQPTLSPSGDGPTVRDGSVGYIDSAVPQGQLRLRYDGAYRIDRPNRAEFIWARGGPLGPGVPRPENSIDYQELSAYGEALVTPRLSVFFEAPVRWLIFSRQTDEGLDETWERLRAMTATHPVSIEGKLVDVGTAYGRCDIVVCPSELESFCRVAAEAMLNGIPVVGSDLEPHRTKNRTQNPEPRTPFLRLLDLRYRAA